MADILPAAPVDPAHQKAAAEAFQAALEKATDEEALGQAVETFIEALVGGTRLDVTLSGQVLSGTTAGGRTFTGQSAASGSAIGTGFLDISNILIFTATTSYEFVPGTIDRIYFYAVAGRQLMGTWTGKLLPSVSQAFKGAGSFRA